MPPTHSMDVPALGPVFILQESLNEDNCRIAVTVHTSMGIIDDKTLRRMEMSTYDFQERPTVKRGAEPGTFVFEFDIDTVEDTIPTILDHVLNEFAERQKRHQHFEETGPGVAVYSEVKTHG